MRAPSSRLRSGLLFWSCVVVVLVAVVLQCATAETASPLSPTRLKKLAKRHQPDGFFDDDNYNNDNDEKDDDDGEGGVARGTDDPSDTDSDGVSTEETEDSLVAIRRSLTSILVPVGMVTLRPHSHTMVGVHFRIHLLQCIDYKDESFEVELYRTDSWHDARLLLPRENSTGNVFSEIPVYSGQFPQPIWEPDLVSDTMFQTSFPLSDLRDYDCVLRNTGRNICIEKVIGKFKVDFDYRHYPFDSQMFSIPFRVANYPKQFVELYPLPNPVTIADFSLQEYDLKCAWVQQDLHPFQSSVAVNLMVERIVLPYVITYILPSMAICVLAFFTMFLSPYEGMRDQMSVTVFLSLILQIYSIMMDLPKMPSPCPMHYLVLYMVLLAVLSIFTSLLWRVLVMCEICQSGSDTERKIHMFQGHLDVWCRWFVALSLLGVFGWFVFLSHRLGQDVESVCQAHSSSSTPLE
eukprot:gnl/Spiro4/24309_TR12073_c0_g1_i1.p1 gnl/Spiro4/24309_TR12073_c0_g1~~gnl/Spiro4/24309_TR12073_c0_g1_i1.p1  ORF type:complete len:463 (+),score=97.70 gnl/Spiro4/24309_TR12073_c0_g1_i1:118-1506(+)